jgi:hypothetical protein
MVSPDNKRMLRTRSSGVLIYDQLLSDMWASARRKSASRYAHTLLCVQERFWRVQFE